MSKDRVIEEYRRHKLLSMIHQGQYKGRVWKEKELLVEIEGDGIEQVLGKLRDYVDSQFVKIAENRVISPDVKEYVKAFQTLIPVLSDGHLSMLKAHFSAPKQEITATQLSEAAGYSNYGAANLQYGLVGKMLYEELPIDLPKRNDNSLIYTYALATAGEMDAPEDHWVWKLRPEVSSAIESLGLNT